MYQEEIISIWRLNVWNFLFQHFPPTTKENFPQFSNRQKEGKQKEKLINPHLHRIEKTLPSAL